MGRPESNPLDAAAGAAERRMIMDEVKNYPHYLDYPKPSRKMTNADRIRAMSDEELAKMMTSGAGEFDCYECWRTEDEPCDLNCEVRCLEWLRKPVEEG